MPDADIAAMKAILQKIEEDLSWFAEQLLELKRQGFFAVNNGSTYLVADLEPQAGIPPVPGPFPDLPTTQSAVITHAQTYRSARLNAKP